MFFCHQSIFCHLFERDMFEVVPFSEGQPKDFRAFHNFFGLPIFSFIFLFVKLTFFCFINFTAWYLAFFYKSSSICNFVDLNYLRRFTLSFIALATLSSNQSCVLFLIFRSLKGVILLTTLKIFSMRSTYAILTLENILWSGKFFF